MLFDFDGTLLDGTHLPLAVRGAADALAEAIPGLDPDAVIAANTAEWQELWPEVEDDWMLGTLPGERINDRAWRGTLARCCVHDDALVALASRTFRDRERRVMQPSPDVLPALEVLRNTGHRIGLITSGVAVLQRDKIARLGLDGALDPVVISSEIGVAKPDRGVFDAALALGGLEAASTWFLGDNLWVYVLGARWSGLVPVWVNRTGRPRPRDAPEADHEVVALTALPELLGRAPAEPGPFDTEFRNGGRPRRGVSARRATR